MRTATRLAAKLAPYANRSSGPNLLAAAPTKYSPGIDDSSTPTGGFGLRWRGRGKELEEQLLLDLRSFPLRREGEWLAGRGHQRSQGPLRVIAQGGDDFRRHQFGGAGFLQRMPQTLLQFLRRIALERQAHPQREPTGKRSSAGKR